MLPIGLGVGLNKSGGDTTPGGAADALLLEDGTSGLLLEDGTSFLLLETA